MQAKKKGAITTQRGGLDLLTYRCSRLPRFWVFLRASLAISAACVGSSSGLEMNRPRQVRMSLRRGG